MTKLWLRVTKQLPQGKKASRWQGEFKLKPLALDHATPESLSPTLPQGPDRSLALRWGRMPVTTSGVCDTESKWVLNCFGDMHPFESLMWASLWRLLLRSVSRKVLLCTHTVLQAVLGGLWTPWSLPVRSSDKKSWCTGLSRMPETSESFSSPEMLAICPPKAIQCSLPSRGVWKGAVLSCLLFKHLRAMTVA